MKFLYNDYRSFKNTRNWCWVDSNNVSPESGEGDWQDNELIKRDIERDDLEGSERKERILEILKRPVEFSLRDIKFIEKNRALIQHDKKFRYHFRKISEYFLSLAVVKSNVIPPRVLYEIGNSKLSRDFLPSSLKKNIDLLIEKDLETISDLSNEDPQNWGDSQTAQIVSLYKTLKKRNKKIENKKLDEVFRNISKKLVQRAVDIAQSNNELDTSQKLLLWEIRRQIPEAFRTNQEVANLLNEKSEENAEKLLKEILEGEKKNSPSLILLWDLIEDLAYQNNVSVNQNDKKKLRNFILRSNASQLLVSIQETTPKVLLPIHLEALKQLDSQNFKHLWDKTNKDFTTDEINISEESSSNKKKQEKLKEKIKLLDKEIKSTRSTKFQDLLDEEKVEGKQKVEYETQQAELETFFNEKSFDSKTIKTIAEDVRGLLSSKNRDVLKRKFEDALLDLTTPEKSIDDKVSSIERLIQLLEEQKRAGWNTAINEEISKKEKEGATEKAQDTREKILDALNEKNADSPSSLNNSETNDIPEEFNQGELERLTGILDTLKNNNVDKTAKRKKEDLDMIKDECIETLNQEANTQVKTLKKNLETLQQEFVDQKIKKEKDEKIIKIYENPEEIREHIHDDYKEAIDYRIKNHQLFAADFQVLMDDENKPRESANIQNFRDKFKEVLDNANIDLSDVEQAIRDIDVDNEDQNLDHLSTYIETIDKQIGVSFFREQLKNELSQFQSSQMKDEIIKGAMGHFNNAIEGKIKSAINMLPEDQDAFWNQKNFFLNQVRSHSPVNTSAEITELESAYMSYFSNKIGLDKKTETEQNLLEGAIEGLPDEEKEKIRKAFNVGINYLQKGYNHNDFQFPGSQKLNEASIETKAFSLDLNTFIQEYNQKMDSLVTEVSTIKSDPRNIKSTFYIFQKSWKSEGKENLNAKIRSFESLCRNVIFNEKDENGNLIYEKFLENYFKTINDAVINLNNAIDQLTNTINSGATLTGKEQIFTLIGDCFMELRSWASFDSGELTKYKNNIENRLFDHQLKDEKGKNIKDSDGKNIDEKGFAETVQSLKSYGVFEDRKKAQEEFETKRASFRESAKNFDDTANKVKSRLQFDINKLSDDKFQEKYGMYKDEAKTTLTHFDTYKDRFDEQWDKFDKPNYFEEWWNKYEKDEESRFAAIREFQDIERLDVTAAEMAEKVGDFDNWLNDWSEYGETERKNRWYNRVTTQSFSLYSIYLLIKQNMDIVETRWKRNQDRMAYNVGMQIYGDSAWGKEFRRMSEDSEEERVKQWEGNYASLDVWQTAEHLYKTNDPDEAKACIIILNNKGYLKWDNPRLWRTLMRLQSSVSFNIPEDMSLEIKEITRKVGDACEIIWSKDDFNTWDTSMDDSMKKAKGGYEKEFRDLTDSRDSENNSMLAKELSSMLEKWSKGDTTDVYPDKFFSFLHMAFEQGKLNGQPDKRWYYLIKGVTTKNPQGEALLPKSVFQKFNNDLLANMPYFDFFIDKASWKKDGKIVPEDTPGAKQRIWLYEDYLAWGDMMGDGGGNFFPSSNSQLDKNIEKFFYDIIDMSDGARGRVIRMGRGTNSNADHDDGETFFTGLEEEQVLQLLSSRSEGTQQITNDFWRAYLAGFDRFMKNKKRFINEGDIEYGKDNNGWQKMKKKTLRDVGVKLKTASAVVQVLSGNMDSPNQTPLIFNEKSWEKDFGDTTIKKAQDSKDEINGMLFKVIDIEGGNNSGYKKNLEKRSYLTTTNAKALRENAEWKAINKKNNEFFSDEGGGRRYFQNTEAIWSVLKNYGSNGFASGAADDYGSQMVA